MEGISRYMRATRNSQKGISKEKSYLTIPTSFYDKMTEKGK